jgi:Rps23 Pro-64 3,4-dihydroxylase Tpa1-like proline 4-hydroxylase
LELGLKSRNFDEHPVTVADIFNKLPPHGLVRDWLGTPTVERLLCFGQSNEHRFEDTRVKRGEAEIVDHRSRVSRKLNLGTLEAEVRTKVQDLLPNMFDGLGIKPFVASKIEVELVAHGDGAFFERHVDTLTRHRGRHRIITAVYYFHALPKAFSGGVLRLHSLAATGKEGTFVDIAPDYDTIIFFPSFFPHEVLPVKCTSGQFMNSRFAVNFWINRS